MADAAPNYRYFGSSYLNTGRWTVGPTIELHLNRHFSVELDALLRGYSTGSLVQTSYGSPFSPLLVSSNEDVKAWDFPLLLKYRFTGRPARRPFLNIGASFTHESIDGRYKSSCIGPETCFPGQTISPFYLYGSSYSRSRGGAVLGGGVEFTYHQFKIAPEFRYTRLSNPQIDQATLLVGFLF